MIQFFKNNRLFAKFTGINLLSKIGDRLFYTAMLTIAASLPEENVAVMIVSVSETLPILLSFFFEVVADKQERKIKQMIISSLIRGVLYLSIGLIFRYPATLTLVLVAAILNLLSDISGNYSSALFSPFTKNMIKAEDMEKAQGLISIGTQLVSVAATFLGAFLLTFFTASSVAMINAFIFILVSLLYQILRPALLSSEAEIKTSNNQKTFSVVKQNFKSIISNRSLLVNIIQLAMLNGFFGGLTPIFALFIKSNTELIMLSNPLKISVLSGCITIFMVVGNALTSRVMKGLPIYKINVLSDVLIIVVAIGFFFNSIWIVILANSCIAFLLGIVSPRFSTEIVNGFPIERIGGIVTSVNAILVITPPITSLLFPVLSTINILIAYSAFLVYAFIGLLISSEIRNP